MGNEFFLSTSIFRWRFLKKKVIFFFGDEVLAEAAIHLFNSYNY